MDDAHRRDAAGAEALLNGEQRRLAQRAIDVEQGDASEIAGDPVRAGEAYAEAAGAFAKVGGRIDAIFFCPHPADSTCDCRKPGAGLFRQIGEPRWFSFPDVLKSAERVIAKQVTSRTGYYARNRTDVFFGTASFADEQTVEVVCPSGVVEKRNANPGEHVSRGASLFTVVRGIAIVRIESRTAAAIQAAVWDRLIALPLPFFRDYSAGELATRAMGVEEIRRVMTGAVLTGLLAGVFSLANLALLFWYDPVLGAVGAGLIVVSLLVSITVGVLQLHGQRGILELRSRISGMMLQFLTGIAKLKLAGAEPQAFSLWARAFGEQRDRQFHNRALGVRLAVFNAAYPVLCSILLFTLAGGRLGSASALGTGEFLGFVAAFGLCLGAVLSTSTAVLQALGAVPLYEQVKPILRTSPEVRPGKDDPGELSGAIELQHVSFRYAADGPQVLRDVSVRIEPGEFVAFVGPSGSGKSTLFRLLLGFETPEVGSVSFDEQDLGGLDVEAVRRQMGVVLQSGRVMAGDLFTNIAGSSAATLDDAWEAARMAGLDDDVRRMPMGMHTMVSDGGGTLSGGQRQRLMIARAIVNRPRILLMDEATSALDNRTQAIVSASLDGLRATRVVIAHRLSTIQRADRIHVLVAGAIVESGTFDELMARDGVFASMARRQLA